MVLWNALNHAVMALITSSWTAAMLMYTCLLVWCCFNVTLINIEWGKSFGKHHTLIYMPYQKISTSFLLRFSVSQQSKSESQNISDHCGSAVQNNETTWQAWSSPQHSMIWCCSKAIGHCSRDVQPSIHVPSRKAQWLLQSTRKPISHWIELYCEIC